MYTCRVSLHGEDKKRVRTCMLTEKAGTEAIVQAMIPTYMREVVVVVNLSSWLSCWAATRPHHGNLHGILKQQPMQALQSSGTFTLCSMCVVLCSTGVCMIVYIHVCHCDVHFCAFVY